MNTGKRFPQVLAQFVVAIGFAIILAGALAGQLLTASAQEPSPQQRQHGIATLFGMQTLAPRQTAQITVVNPSEMIPCVRVRLAFDLYEQDPTDPSRLRFARSVSREVDLEPGETASFDYTAGGRGAFVSPASFAREINEVSDPHAPTRVSQSDAPTPIRTRTLGAISALVVNERGTVLFTAPGVRVGFDPQPDPPTTNRQN